MKTEMTSHDTIERITMNEEELKVRFPQGRLTIKADANVTTIEYRAIDNSSRVLSTSITVIDLNNERLPHEFKLALVTKKE